MLQKRGLSALVFLGICVLKFVMTSDVETTEIESTTTTTADSIQGMFCESCFVPIVYVPSRQVCPPGQVYVIAKRKCKRGGGTAASAASISHVILAEAVPSTLYIDPCGKGKCNVCKYCVKYDVNIVGFQKGNKMILLRSGVPNMASSNY